MAAAKVAVTRVHTGDRLVDASQDQAQRASRAFNAVPFSNGVWVRNVLIGTSNTVVNHGLGRIPQGYIITRLQSNAVYPCESLAGNQPPDRTKQYAFISSVAVTVDIWFF